MVAKNNNVKRGKIEPGELPQGFVLVTQRVDGFFAREIGNSVRGILRGDFTTRGKFGEKKVYRIEITQGETQIEEGKIIGEGAIIGLHETGYTKKLSDLETGTAVFIRYEGKEPGDKSPHVFTVGKVER